MDGIPPTRDGDTEDVIWALETAESLWKRQARVDAIVWLRRAAQAAADSGDGDRAATLTRDAAALTEAFGHPSSQMRSAAPAEPDESDDIDALLDAAEELDDADLISSPPPTPVAGSDYPLATSSKGRPPPPPPRRPPPPRPVAALHAELAPAIAVPRSPLPPIPPESGLDLGLPPPRPLELSLPPESELLPRELDASPGERFEAPTKVSAETLPAFAVPTTSHPAPAPSEPPQEDATEPEELPARPASVAPPSDVGITPMGADALSALDLADLEALGNVSDDQRELLARTASVLLCGAGVVVPRFALALVLEGQLTIHTEGASRIIARVGPGTLIHTRGTLDAPRALHIDVSSDDTTVALWSEESLGDALATSPWVEEDLCADGDRLQAWAEVAASPLAARLHDDVRLRLYGKLAVRALAAGDELLAEGAPVAGLFLVGAGSILIAGATEREMTPGEFVFPEAALSAARATSRAAAGSRGAILLVADRKTTQELCSTEPLLLELLAGM